MTPTMKAIRLSVTILGPLRDEPTESMTRAQFDVARKRLKASLDQIVTMDVHQDARQTCAIFLDVHRSVEGCRRDRNYRSRRISQASGSTASSTQWRRRFKQ